MATSTTTTTTAESSSSSQFNKTGNEDYTNGYRMKSDQPIEYKLKKIYPNSNMNGDGMTRTRTTNSEQGASSSSIGYSNVNDTGAFIEIDTQSTSFISIPSSNTISSSNSNSNSNSYHTSKNISTSASANTQPLPSWTTLRSTHRSLYNRATTAFVKKEFGLSYEILESALGILNSTSTINEDGKEIFEWRLKWDILRLTIEALLYASPSLLQSQSQDGKGKQSILHSQSQDGKGKQSILHSQDGKGKGKQFIPSNLEYLLVNQSPSGLVETMYTRSLQLFNGNNHTMNHRLPSSLVLTIVMAGLKVQAIETSRYVAENWFSTESDDRHPEKGKGKGKRSENDEGYRKLLRTYCCQVLPLLGEWELAISVLERNDVLDGKEKEVSSGFKAFWLNIDYEDLDGTCSGDTKTDGDRN
jgi:hypothetical protein